MAKREAEENGGANNELSTLCSRLVVLREGLVPVDSEDPALQSERALSTHAEADVSAGALEPRWSELARRDGASALTWEAAAEGKRQTASLDRSMRDARERSSVALLGRKVLREDTAEAAAASAAAAGDAAGRILQALLAMPGRKARAAMLPSAFEAAGTDDAPDPEEELLSTSPLRLLQAVDLALARLERGVAAGLLNPDRQLPGAQLPAGKLLVSRPLAALAVLPRPLVLFAAGAVSGAIGKSLTAPLDRVKLLLQTRGGLGKTAVAAAARGGGVLDALVAIGREEGLRGYWKGNLPQILRVVPYSATQLYSYEVLKRAFADRDGKLSVPARLGAGACAGMTATLVTYPLDTLRLRLAVDPAVRSLRGAALALLREGSYAAFFRGLGASMLGIAPYMAIELAVFDLIPRHHLPFARGFTAAFLATTACYPLDTVRRQIQLQSSGSVQVPEMVRRILAREGVPGFYRGFLPNALKNLPNKGVRLATFDAAKKLLESAEAAYAEEAAQVAA
ncbi:hypothetical protein WJX81_003355 [Elliptochloris bilobata]|uniref:Uncharacterized protein n=1 Tax=Elliptochloris bilobata TaxID=381761 RepID=A0AAW1RRV3_9CHLO